MKTVVSIAGSDSGGGAGIQQDLKTFSSFGLHGATVLTAITAQNTLGVQDSYDLPLKIIDSQLDSVFSDLRPAAVKTGMLSSAEIISLVEEKVKHYGVENLVVDPVMVSTSGHRLLSEEAADALKGFLSSARVSTPNIEEAEILSGVKIRSEEDMETAAEKLGSCVVKGGHLHGVDVLHFEGDFFRFETRELKNVHLHGTGCAFSAAIASCLALDMCVPEAVAHAKEFMDSVIERNYSPGGGLRVVDTGGIRLSAAYDSPNEASVAGRIEEAIKLLVSSPCAYKLMPEVGVNVAFALPRAKDLSDVAGISGRLVRCGKRIVPVGVIRFGGTSHVGRIVLTAVKHDPEMRAALNVRFSDEAVSVCEKLGLSVASFDRGKQPPDTPTMEWGTEEAIKGFGGVPDAVFDRGAVGKEPMIRLLGKDPVSVVKTALKVADKL